MTAAVGGVLEGLLDDVARVRGARPLVVMDLDDTLLSTDARHLRILREFGLEGVGPQALRYSITDTARAGGLQDAAELSRLREFWFSRFFRNEYLLADEPVPGAPAYCRELVARGAELVYLTGRDETMRAGTEESLARHGFPPSGRPGARLILKPRFDTPDLEYKTQSLRLLEASGRVAGVFENEPAHVNLFVAAFPEARSVFVDTKHSGRPIAPHPSVPWIRDFRRAA